MIINISVQDNYSTVLSQYIFFIAHIHGRSFFWTGVFFSKLNLISPISNRMKYVSFLKITCRFYFWYFSARPTEQGNSPSRILLMYNAPKLIKNSAHLKRHAKKWSFYPWSIGRECSIRWRYYCLTDTGCASPAPQAAQTSPLQSRLVACKVLKNCGKIQVFLDLCTFALS